MPSVPGGACRDDGVVEVRAAETDGRLSSVVIDVQ